MPMTGSNNDTVLGSAHMTATVRIPARLAAKFPIKQGRTVGISTRKIKLSM